MKIAALKGNARRVTVAFKEEDGFEPGEMWIEYRPGELTIDVVEQIQAGMKDGTEAGAILQMMSKILTDWDLEVDKDDGTTEKVPPTAEGIRILPLPAIGFIFGSIMDDVRPNPPTDEVSEDTLPQEEPQEKSLVGTSS